MLALSKSSCRSLLAISPPHSRTQRRWKVPTNSAQTRMDTRTLDPQLDRLMKRHRRLNIVLAFHHLMARHTAPHLLVQMLSRWKPLVGLNTAVGLFLRKLPHVFELYRHPDKDARCCRLTPGMRELLAEENTLVREHEEASVQKLKKLLMISITGTLHVHAIWLVRRELGLPDDFRDTIIRKYPSEFSLLSEEVVALVKRDECLAEATIEKWREAEYREKWLSEAETKYAFPIQFPAGFKIEKGFRERLKRWQRIQYVKPYDKVEVVRIRTCNLAVARNEKRAVAIVHEMLSLTVERMLPVERFAHFRRDFRMVVNLREVLLKHPGIFYISTRNGTLTVLLREAYSKGCLIEPNPIYNVRRKMLELVTLGCRNTKALRMPLQDCVGESNAGESG